MMFSRVTDSAPAFIRRRKRRLAMVGAAAALSVPAGMVTASPASAGPGPFYWIISVSSGKALMPYNETKDAYAPIVQSGQANLGAQHWKIKGAGNLRRLENRHSKHCILISFTQNQFLRQWYCDHNHDVPHHEEPADMTRTTWIPSNYDDMWAGLPITWMSYYGGLGCMAVSGVAAIGIACNGGTAQQFRLVHVPGT